MPHRTVPHPRSWIGSRSVIAPMRIVTIVAVVALVLTAYFSAISAGVILDFATTDGDLHTSTASSLPEVAGGAAELVEPLDAEAVAAACRRVREDPPLRMDIVARGLKRVEKLTWQKNAEAVCRCYGERLS